MNRALQRALIGVIGRPVQTGLRNAPWPIKWQILRAPPIAWPTRAASPPLELLCQATNKTWLDALWAVYSWAFFAKNVSSATISIDGVVLPEMERDLRRILPDATLRPAGINHGSGADLVHEELKRAENRSRFGKKLSTIIEHSTSKSFLYLDADVLCFAMPAQILDGIADHPQIPLYNRDNSRFEANSKALLECMGNLGISPIPGFNSGLMYIPKGAIDLHLCRECLNYSEQVLGDYFMDQSIFNAALSQKGAVALDISQYLISSGGMYFWDADDVDYDRIVARHFVGIVRHRMYLGAMPFLKARFLRG